MMRMLDVFFALFGMIFGLPLFLVLLVAGYLDTGSPMFCQVRVGRNLNAFVLFKLRTMKPDAVSVATHLANTADITPYGRFLRRSKLDELPQLYNVLKGEMSLVAPRPCLFSQEELIAARIANGVFYARPGITGLAQIRGIDMSAPKLLAETDAQMLRTLSIENYFKYIFLTLVGKGAGDRVKEKAE